MVSDRSAEASVNRIQEGYKMLTESFTGPAAYLSGGNTFASRVLSELERANVLGVSAGQVTGGFAPQVATGTISGAQFTVLFFEGDTGRGVIEVATGTDLSAVAFTVLLEGR